MVIQQKKYMIWCSVKMQENPKNEIFRSSFKQRYFPLLLAQIPRQHE